MEIRIDPRQIRERVKLFVATPMYGGQCMGMYTKSMCDLTTMCVQMGIDMRAYYLFNESLITRARNYCVDEFMRSDCTHLLFIDSDIGFDAQDVLALLALCTDDSPYDVIGGPYPKKTIAWEKVIQAVNAGAGKDNPNQLEDYVGDYVFNPVGGVTEIKISEPAEVSEIGTGFMLTRRKTFEKYAEHYGPIISYKPDHARTEHFDGSREIMMYFQAEIDAYNPTVEYREVLERISKNYKVPTGEVKELLKKVDAKATESSKRYLSEDYLFCKNVRDIGLHVWICPWMKLKHAGSYVFGGSLAALASVGANPTVDESLITKKGM